MSNSVAKGLEFSGDLETTETQRFCSMFDRFFDCLNGRNLSEHIKRRKPDLKPYYRSDDERLDVSTIIKISDLAIDLHFCHSG